MLTINKDVKIDEQVVQDYLSKHYSSERYKQQTELYNAYVGKYPILERYLSEGKPNNKIVNNYAKFIVDTFCGFFDGNPMVVGSDNQIVQEAVDHFNNENTTVEQDYELIKNAAIFGNVYELIYQNEVGETKSAIVNPLNGFVVYDNTIERKPVFGVRYAFGDNNELIGEVYTNDFMYSLTGKGTEVENMTVLQKNEFYQVNLIEYVFNKERQGIFENAMTAINAYNQVLSDKTNDVEYFSDAMLKVIGAELPDFQIKDGAGYRPATNQEKANEFIKNMRNNRLIIANGNKRGAEKPERPEIEFLAKPESDSTQENLLNRLEKQIFHLSMVANISDENFGNASGVSLRYKLLGMRNLAKTVERNLTKSFKERYKLVFSFEKNIPHKYSNEYKELKFKFSENLPEDETAQTSNILALVSSGLISKQTAMSLLPFVEDVSNELSLIHKEKQESVELYTSQTYTENLEGVENHEEERT